MQETFDRSAAVFSALYSQRAREVSNLGDGKIVVAIGIAPDGNVSHCELVSSTFNDPVFEDRIVGRILQLNFGARDVPEFEVPHYPIDFRPM